MVIHEYASGVSIPDKLMAIAPTRFDIPQAYSAVDFSPLARLGQFGRQRPTVADLGNLNQPQTATPPPVTPSPGGTSASFSAPPTAGNVNAALKATAADAGMDVPTWKAVASIESSLNPSSNFDKPTQYKGLFQIGAHEFATHGKGDTYNPMDNARAAASLAKANSQIFRDNFGRDPSPTEIYLMHQQGPGFYTKGTMTNVAGNPYPGMIGPQTPESFAAGWGREIERRARYFRQFEQ